MTTRHTIEIDLSQSDNVLCDSLPREVFVRFAAIAWLVQFEHLLVRIEDLSETLKASGFDEQRERLLKEAEDFLARMKAKGIGLDDQVH